MRWLDGMDMSLCKLREIVKDKEAWHAVDHEVAKNWTRLNVCTTTAKETPFIDCFWASQVALVVKSPPANAGDVRDVGSIPESGRSPGGKCGNPLQYSCLKNPMDRRAWWPTVHRVSKSQTQLKQITTHTHIPHIQR